MTWFRKKEQRIESVPADERVVKTEGIFVKCTECDAALYKRELEESLQVCPHCSYHFRIGARERLAMLYDDGQYEELDADVISSDPLEFTDTKPYPQRLEQARRSTGLPEAIITARGRVGGHLTFIGAMDFSFLGGSMGSAVGEKITRIIEQTIREKLPKDFQRAEFLVEHGMLDVVVDRREMRALVIKLLTFMVNPALQTPAPQFNASNNGRDPNGPTPDVPATESKIQSPKSEVKN